MKKIDLRHRLSKVRVLINDADPRSAQLVRQVLNSFGLRAVTVVHSGRDTLQLLRTRGVDILLTEWVTDPVNGMDLIQAVRNAKDDRLLKRDLPIVMLTARAERRSVEAARDAGVNEFVAKPFSAKTLSVRLIELIDAPREYVEAPGYVGPSRRRRVPHPDQPNRRVPMEVRRLMKDAPPVTISKPNLALSNMLGTTRASDILTDEIVAEAQHDLMKIEGDFVAWVQGDIVQLELSYAQLVAHPDNTEARAKLLKTAYAIKSQSGMFGYEIGTLVAALLIDYLDKVEVISESNLIVIRKHIDTLSVIFTKKIKDPGSDIGNALIASLNQLVAKLG